LYFIFEPVIFKPPTATGVANIFKPRKISRMTSKLIGFITDIFPVETKPNFAKQIVWIKQPDTERYPQHWQVEVHNSDIDRLRHFKRGQKVEAEVEIRGRKWTKQSGEESIMTTLKLVGMAVIE
jgi:hypothetical protein